MPKTAVSKTALSRLQLAFLCFAVMLALAAPDMRARASVDARLGPDEVGDAAAAFAYTVPDGAISLTGFHCGLIGDESVAAFATDPDYSEAPPTIGLEFVADAGGLPPLTATIRPGSDEMTAADMKTPLSAKLNRILIEAGGASLNDGRAMEEVSLPEASMSVADLVDRCHP